MIQNIFLRTRKGILSVPVEFNVHRDSFGLDKLDLRIEPIRSVGGDVGTVQSGGFMSKSDFPRIFYFFLICQQTLASLVSLCLYF